jgi:hypothetical protein
MAMSASILLEFQTLPIESRPSEMHPGFGRPAFNFVGDFRVFRLERRHGSCNVYQSVKLSVSCQPKAIAEIPGQQKQQGSGHEDHGNNAGACG